MADPVGLLGNGGGVGPVKPAQGPQGPAKGAPGAPSFKDTLLQNLEQVNELQQDATAAIEDLQAGRRSDLEGVILATQKADTAFKMLQSVRNKVLEAYEQIQQMRT